MSFLLTLLLAGLIVFGMALDGIVTEPNQRRSRGKIAQFLFGVLLLICYILLGGRFPM